MSRLALFANLFSTAVLRSIGMFRFQPMKMRASILYLLASLSAIIYGEVPQAVVTPANAVHLDHSFVVKITPNDLMHEEFPVSSVYIGVDSGQAVPAPSVTVNIWKGNEFISKVQCASTPLENLPFNEREAFSGHSVYVFSVNDEYLHDTWVSYFIDGQGKSESRECIIRLSDQPKAN